MLLAVTSFSMGPKDWVILVLAVVAAVAVIKALWRAGDKLETWHEDCDEAAEVASDEGHSRIAFILHRLAMADASGAVAAFKALLAELRKPEDRAAIFDKQFKLQLANRLKDEEKRAQIVAAVAPYVDAARAAANAAGKTAAVVGAATGNPALTAAGAATAAATQ